MPVGLLFWSSQSSREEFSQLLPRLCARVLCPGWRWGWTLIQNLVLALFRDDFTSFTFRYFCTPLPCLVSLGWKTLLSRFITQSVFCLDWKRWGPFRLFLFSAWHLPCVQEVPVIQVPEPFPLNQLVVGNRVHHYDSSILIGYRALVSPLLGV